jgi:hypothetical protein
MNLADNVVTWTVKAFDNDIIRLEEYADIQGSQKFFTPLNSESTLTVRHPHRVRVTRPPKDASSVVKTPLEEEPVDKWIGGDWIGYLVHHKNSHNKAETEKTETFLRELEGVVVHSSSYFLGWVEYWTVYNSE